jgi:hypothetical protein
MPQLLTTFQVMLGSSRWDACAYVRSLTEDTVTPYLVPDSAYIAYAEDVAEDFSRYVPLDVQLGNPVALTSPLQTVVYQQRYVCNVANGFSIAPTRITDVLYQATNAFSAASEISYLALLPFSPLNRFLFTPSLLDSPSERILRDQYLQELDKYGRGYWGTVRDAATGLPALDLYPIPTSAGTPIYVRYQIGHSYTTDNLGNVAYVTVPEQYKRQFARLLYCQILEQEQDRFIRGVRTQAGILSQETSPAEMNRKIMRIRNAVYQELGDAVPAVFHTF